MTSKFGGHAFSRSTRVGRRVDRIWLSCASSFAVDQSPPSPCVPKATGGFRPRDYPQGSLGSPVVLAAGTPGARRGFTVRTQDDAADFRNSDADGSARKRYPVVRWIKARPTGTPPAYGGTLPSPTWWGERLHDPDDVAVLARTSGLGLIDGSLSG